MKFSLLTLFSILLIYTNSFAEVEEYQTANCHVKRATFLIENYNIIGKVAEVDKCQKKINNIITEKTISVTYKQEIEQKTGGKDIPPGIIYQTIIDIDKLEKELGIDCNQIKCVAILSEMISTSNSKPEIFSEYIKRKNNVKLVDMSLEDKGKLITIGIFANNLLPDSKQKDFMLFDFSSDSFKITRSNNNKKYSFSIDYGADDFKKDFFKKVKNLSNDDLKNIAYSVSNNEVQLANKICQDRLIKEIGQHKEVVDYFKEINISYAVGDILEKVLLNILESNANYFSKVDILNSITRLTDIKIIKDNSSLKNRDQDAIINLIYIYSIMGILDIERVYFFTDISVADGILVEEKFWK